MWFDALVILGTCAAAIIFGFFVYWIIIKIQKLLARQSNSMQAESQTPITFARDNQEPASESPSKKTNNTPDFQMKIDTENQDDVCLNRGASGALASTAKNEDDDWMNANVEEVPTNVYKQQDDDWLNAENDQFLETSDESSSNLLAARRPEIEIIQDGSAINIFVTTSLEQDAKPEKYEDNRPLKTETEKISTSRDKQRDDDWLNPENEQTFETKVGSAQNPSPVNQREIQIKQDGFLLNIAVRASKKQDTKSEHTVTNLKISLPPKDLNEEEELPKEEEINFDDPSDQSIQDIVPVKLKNEPTDQSNPLMDEIAVRPVEGQGESPKNDWGLSDVD
jgi:hypothetical protein